MCFGISKCPIEKLSAFNSMKLFLSIDRAMVLNIRFIRIYTFIRSCIKYKLCFHCIAFAKTNFRLSQLGVDHTADEPRAFRQLHMCTEQCTAGFCARSHIQRWVFHTVNTTERCIFSFLFLSSSHLFGLMKFKWYYRHIYLWFVLPPSWFSPEASYSYTFIYWALEALWWTFVEPVPETRLCERNKCALAYCLDRFTNST